MGTAVYSTQQVFESSLPGDLREWVDQHTLARMVMAAVNSEGSNSNIAPQLHTVLSLLAFCYACGIQGSRDIEFRSTQDEMVKHLCAGSHPEARELRCFRRHHRQSVKHCLAEVLQQAWQIHLGAEGPHPEAAGSSPSVPDPRMNCGGRFLDEAEERIDWAVRQDCWESDW